MLKKLIPEATLFGEERSSFDIVLNNRLSLHLLLLITNGFLFIIDLFIKLIFLIYFFDFLLLANQLNLVVGISIYSLFILLAIIEFKESIYSRSKDRFSLSFPHHSLKIKVKLGNKYVNSRLLDFSKSSAYIYLENSVKRSQKVELHISLGGEVFEIPGVVIHQSKNYLGIGFENQMIFRAEQSWENCYDTMNKMNFLSGS